VTNQFIDEANKFDMNKVKQAAANFKLKDEWQNVTVPTECK
jgi:hypothetical protein